MNKEKVMELKTNMAMLEDSKKELAMRKEDFEMKNKVLIEHIQGINDDIDACKGILKENAEVEYGKTGFKKLLGGIGIRVSQITVYDETEALTWAKEKDMFLQLDKKGFEKVAKTGEINFVKLEDKVTITFPKEIKLED